MSSPTIFTVDIETRPTEAYVWSLFGEQRIGLNQIIRPGGLLMFAAKKYGEKKIEARCDWDGYEEMVTRSHEIYDAADYIVTFNGARFDNKHLRASWAELGLTPPSPWRDIDLYKTVGKFQWPSRKLAYVCSALGLDHKTDSGGMETWDHILRGDEEQQAKAQRKMVRYCRNDVAITEQLFDRLRPWVDGLNLPLYDEDLDVFSCTRCGSNSLQMRGFAYTTTYRYQRYRCNDCGGWMKDKKCEPTVNAELRNVVDDWCFYNIIHYDHSPLTLTSLRAQVRSIEDLVEANGVDFSDEPLEIWAKDGEIGLFVGDTSTLAGDGWFRRV